MNASELELLWQKQQSMNVSPENIGQITATVDAVDRKFRRKIWWRDLREIGAALFFAALFGFVGQTWVRWLAVASCLFVVAWIIRSRMMVRPDKEIPSVTGRLQQMIRDTETQIQLTRTLLWWYLLPGVLAMLFVILDSPPRHFHPPSLLIAGAVAASILVAIYWLNRWALRKVLEPRRANLRHALAELSESS